MKDVGLILFGLLAFAIGLIVAMAGAGTSCETAVGIGLFALLSLGFLGGSLIS